VTDPALAPATDLRRPAHPRRGVALAAGALLGACVGFGVRAGSPFVVFTGATNRLRGLPDFVSPDRGLGRLALLGLAHTAVVAALWGALLVLAARAPRGRRAALALTLATALALAALDAVLPEFLRLAAGAPGAVQRVVLALAAGAAAWAGVRAG
jgi:hypothetical protein